MSTPPVYTLAEGCPYADATTARRFSDGFPVKGLMLLQDTQLLETLAHFSRERIPEHIVHANAVGAWGEFEVTHDISHLTCAKFLTGIGTKSKTLSRISTVGPGAGSSDTVRDVRGWALKIFTDEGNQDFVFNDIPVFFIRDPIKFPSLNRSHKRHPATNITDSTMFWDFHAQNQESIHAVMLLFGDRGIPKSARHVNGYSGHTYKLTKSDGSSHYVKFHFKSNQGNATLTDADANRLAGEDPDNTKADLYNAIEAANFPSWTLLAAFSPSTMVPGLAPSADPSTAPSPHVCLPDAARYRLGANYQQLPCNRPVAPVYAPYQRDGFATVNGNYAGDPNYVRSALKPLSYRPSPPRHADAAVSSADARHDIWDSDEVTDEDIVQARMLFRDDVLGKREGQQERLISNVVSHLGKAKPVVWQAAFDMFSRVSPELGEAIRTAVVG
ncbi:catalase-like domain-containing protein [Chaetomidium leptoderma]|uniref:Catalase-like domain-containing protein n=1 Tax=Chaetomidium leptoderma TaxID=669021 RepID=A0AAN6VRS5_9PEZI|nr:catalase-like domain-containing protein [Chaetomidium leptoderma]